jgi:hypothetical protein
MYSIVGSGRTQYEHERGENKVDFQGVVKVGDSGIFGWMDVYCLVIAAIF